MSNQILFCLPSAGAGSNIYSTWSAALAPRVRIRPVTLPGRERLFSEPPLRDCASLIARLVPDIASQIDRPYAMFGHSMGALVCFELAYALRQAGHPEPACLVLSGYPAPQVPRRRPPLHEAPDDQIMAMVRHSGGVPDDLLANRDYCDFLLPVMRADLAVVETYRYTPRPPLSCPMIAVGGDDDDVCPREELEPWRELTTGPFRLRIFPGRHFHLFEQRQPFLDFLRETLSS